MNTECSAWKVIFSYYYDLIHGLEHDKHCKKLITFEIWEEYSTTAKNRGFSPQSWL